MTSASAPEAVRMRTHLEHKLKQLRMQASVPRSEGKQKALEEKIEDLEQLLKGTRVLPVAIVRPQGTCPSCGRFRSLEPHSSPPTMGTGLDGRPVMNISLPTLPICDGCWAKVEKAHNQPKRGLGARLGF